ncbi:MAG: hypothetical protein ACK41Q_14170, partial [Candidatus Brocadia sp.]
LPVLGTRNPILIDAGVLLESVPFTRPLVALSFPELVEHPANNELISAALKNNLVVPRNFFNESPPCIVRAATDLVYITMM